MCELFEVVYSYKLEGPLNPWMPEDQVKGDGNGNAVFRMIAPNEEVALTYFKNARKYPRGAQYEVKEIRKLELDAVLLELR